MPPNGNPDGATARVNLEYYLPFGEMLRLFLDQQDSASGDMRAVLRGRGVFLQDYDKPSAIPRLSLATVTPSEFDLLLEKRRTREESLKVTPKFLKWQSGRSLSSAVPQNLASGGLIPEGASYRMFADTGFHPVDGDANHLRRSFKVQRSDLNKDWTKGDSTHEGSIDIKRIGEGKDAQLVITSTAPETKDLGSRIAHEITKHLKAGGDVDTAEKAKGVEFSDFDNAQRVAFLLSFTGANSPKLRFEAITDFDLAPDDKVTMPPTIAPFVEEVTQFLVKGKQLQRSFFLSKPDHHQFVILTRMEARYRFEYQAAKGFCTVDFSFAGYSSKTRAGEFEVRLITALPDAEFRKVNRLNVYRAVNDIVEEYVQEILRVRRTTAVASSEGDGNEAAPPFAPPPNGAEGQVGQSETAAKAQPSR